MGTDLRERPLDMSLWGSWRGECTIKEKEETEQKKETSQKEALGWMAGTHSFGSIALKYMAL